MLVFAAIPLAGLNWFSGHAKTISERSIDRIAALGGCIVVEHRMAYLGEYLVERYGAAAATRVASYNSWVALSWLITGKTLSGQRIYPERNCLDRETALRRVDRERHVVLQ
jgi:predicted amidohydrolase YtcJ